MQFQLERNIDTVIQYHSINFNRIFADQGKSYRFREVATPVLTPNTPEAKPQTKTHRNFIGIPDTVPILGSNVLSFVEVKTPIDLPVRHPQTGQLFDLLEMYQEDIHYESTGNTRDDIGREDV